MLKNFRLFTICSLFLAMVGFRGAEPDAGENMVKFLFEYLEIKHKGRSFDQLIYIAAKRQRLYYIVDKKIRNRYTISTSKYGVGNVRGSEKTPLGLHHIYKKIGSGVPEGGIFNARKYTGRQAKIITEPLDDEKDDVTSRILWLKGDEPEVNKGNSMIDTRMRCIYIHGTPEEGLIGSPASHGCIRMRNDDIIAFFDLVEPGTMVLILNN